MYYKAPDNSLHELPDGIDPAGSIGLLIGFPRDAVPITDAEAEALSPKPDPVAATEEKKQSVSVVRKQILDILTGIALEAQLKGDTATTDAYLVVLQGLKEITEDWPTDPGLVDDFVMQRYLALRAQCTPQMETAFAQVAS